jgi:hypothetical protein
MISYSTEEGKHWPWHTVELPQMKTVSEIIVYGQDIYAYSANQVAISRNFGATWQLVREKRKYRRYKRPYHEPA